MDKKEMSEGKPGMLHVCDVLTAKAGETIKTALESGQDAFIAVQRGRGILLADGFELPVPEKGYIIYCGKNLEISVRENSLIYIFILENLEQKIACQGRLKGQVGKIFSMAVQEAEEKGYGFSESCDYLFSTLLLLLIREEKDSDRRKWSDSERRENCRKAYNYINRHYQECPQTDFLAHKFGYGNSMQTFRNDFIACYGISPIFMCKEKRIKEAIKLIISTKKGSKEIAEILGYRSQNHFIRDFKKWEGISPTAYRKKVLNEKAKEIMEKDHQMEIEEYMASMC